MKQTISFAFMKCSRTCAAAEIMNALQNSYHLLLAPHLKEVLILSFLEPTPLSHKGVKAIPASQEKVEVY